MDETTKRDDLIDRVLDLNVEISRQIHRGVPREWIETEVTMPQFKTLILLYGMGQATMGELADALGTGVSTVTGIVDRLVEHGLVLREEDPRDRRVVVGRPTAEGIEVVDRVVVAARDRVRQILVRLSFEDLLIVARSTELMRDAALEAFPTIGRCGRDLDQIKVGGT